MTDPLLIIIIIIILIAPHGGGGGGVEAVFVFTVSVIIKVL